MDAERKTHAIMKKAPAVYFEDRQGCWSKSGGETYTIHTNPHIDVEASLGAEGPDGLLSMLQLWPPGLTKAPLRARVKKMGQNPQKTPKRPI